MKHKGLLAVLAACAGIAFTGLPVPGAGDLGTSKAYADSSKSTKAYRAKRAVNGARGHYYIGGYYSYVDEDVVASRARGIRRSIRHTPMADLQSPAGPFDSGFFFDSGLTPHYWNN